jgi:HEAT repeat protein
LLKDRDERVRQSAAWALGEIGAAAKPAVPALIEALKDEDRDVQFRAAEALKRIDPEAAHKAGVP